MTKAKKRGLSSIETTEISLKVEDILRHLSALARLNSNSLTGNPDLSEGLHLLVAALKPYSSILISELTGSLASETRSSDALKKKNSPKVELPRDLESLNVNEIDSILNNPEYSKDQLARLGNERFGISRSKLIRQGKSKLIESIRAAYQHEQSLNTISQEARRGGESRKS
ncbi:MAG: hypothetical protein KBG20_02045 [Caldilineaceae bacterium]|nr:hypothetical protein [Caldilineaceae bacterium]MBP8107888.1 hypothetical protein [Caldilineaceae bacterium]MBP8122653.1 hypothetical protein [Caldilineaceae bacterium]MBP9071045.1 hypothetical protein [Caldilineaceae bacterium]